MVRSKKKKKKKKIGLLQPPSPPQSFPQNLHVSRDALLKITGLEQWSPDWSMCQQPLGGLLKYSLLGPTPEFLIQYLWGGAENLPF